MDTGEYETNTFVVNNVVSVAYRTYEPTPEPVHTFPSAAIEIESSLRDNGHLVIYDTNRRQIWYFQIQEKGAEEDEKSRSLDKVVKVGGHALSLAEEGSFQPSSIQKGRLKAPAATENTQRQSQTAPSVSQPSTDDQDSNAPDPSVPESKTQPIAPKVAYKNFISALLLSTSTAFCQAKGYIPLNYRTVLLSAGHSKSEDGPDASQAQSALLGTFTAYLTTMGALILSFNISQCRGLLPLDNVFTSGFVSPGHTIFAAPFGIQAVNTSNAFGDFGTASLAQTPTTQALSFRGVTDSNEGTWKQACSAALQLRGISSSLLEGCHWVSIGVPRNRLRESKVESRRIRDAAALATISWPGPLCFRQRVFEASPVNRLGNSILNGQEESHDPLGNAKSWLHSSADREEQLSRRRADASVMSSMEIDNSGPQAPPPSAPTPAAFARPSTAIAGAMYPTPPDGFQPPSAITSSFDGATSSPRNHPSITAPVDGEEPGSYMTTTDGAMWNPDNPKRERSDSNHIIEDADSMMMEGEMFEDNDITEADFNFFDEDQQGTLDIDMRSFPPSANRSPQKQEAPQHEFEAPLAIETPPAGRSAQDSGVFMKPEPKYAKNHFSDSTTKVKETPRPITKRGSSPFTREAVFKRICGPDNRHSLDMPPPRRRNSEFETILLSPVLPFINRKYQKGGAFSFDPEATEEKQPTPQTAQIPETNYLKRHSKSNRKSKGPQDRTQTLLKRFTGLEEARSHPSPFRAVALPSDNEDSSAESDEDDSSYTTNDETSPIKSTFKRAPLEEDAASHVTSLRETEADDEPDQQLAIELPRLAKLEPPELQLSKLLLDPEPMSSPTMLADEDIISVAQLIVEQAATGILSLLAQQKDEEALAVAQSQRRLQVTVARDAMSALRKVMPWILRADHSRLKGFLEIADAPLQSQPTRLQPRLVPGREASAEQMRPSSLYQIPSHRLEVRRSEAKLSLLPASVTFWDSLGLAPAHGTKDIQACCVFPGWHGMIDNVKLFMERMRNVYELLKLGSFSQLPLIGDVEPGLVPFEIDRISTSPAGSASGQGSAVVESMESMMPQAISAVKAMEVNLVVFMVYSPNNPGTIVEACSAFQRYFDTYWKPTMKRENAHRELILQLIPADMISSPSAMVVAPQTSVIKLCLETYDRCTLFGSPTPAAAIMLEQALPRIIDFKSTVNPSASLIHENSCIHVAYAQSVDERWVAAAWTDDRGSKQASAGYCLGRKGRPQSLSMQEVAHEIWESTLEIIAYLKVQWRVIITKVGPMDAKEIDFWSDLAKTESKKPNIALMLMTVDTSPSLQLLPPEVQVPPSSAGIYTPPVSTPQANVVSPEQTSTPAPPTQSSATVDSEADPDGALLDLTEQTWGAVVGHRLNNSSTPLELQPALVSGYLIKRTGASLEDPPVVMEVNLVHTENTTRAYEPLLREMLSTFRGLGTLARARGVTEREADVRPWHVAAAEKATRALYLLM